MDELGASEIAEATLRGGPASEKQRVRHGVLR